MRRVILVSLVAALAQCSLIVDRQFNVKKLAEGIPITVTYTLYNTFGK